MMNDGGFPNSLGELEWADEAESRTRVRRQQRVSTDVVEPVSPRRSRPSSPDKAGGVSGGSKRVSVVSCGPPTKGSSSSDRTLSTVGTGGSSSSSGRSLGSSLTRGTSMRSVESSASASGATFGAQHILRTTTKRGGSDLRRSAGKDLRARSFEHSSNGNNNGRRGSGEVVVDDGFRSRRDLYREAALRSTGRAPPAASPKEGGSQQSSSSAPSSLNFHRPSASSGPQTDNRRGRGDKGDSSGGRGGGGPVVRNGRRGSAVIISRSRRHLTVEGAPQRQASQNSLGVTSSADDEEVDIEVMDTVTFEKGSPPRREIDERPVAENSPLGSSSSSGDDSEGGGGGGSGSRECNTSLPRNDVLEGDLGGPKDLGGGGDDSSFPPYDSDGDQEFLSSSGHRIVVKVIDPEDDEDEDKSVFSDFGVKFHKARTRGLSSDHRVNRRLCAFVLIASALIVAVPAISRAVAQSKASEDVLVGSARDDDNGGSPYRPVLLPGYLESNLSDREGYLETLPGIGASAPGEALPGFSSHGIAAASTRNKADVDGAAPTKRDLPLFWSMPHCSPDLIQEALGRCHGLVLASDVGGEADLHSDDEELQVVQANGASFVNVDLTAPDGVSRAARLGLAGSGLADAASTPLLHATAREVLSADRPGRLLTVFRHPVRRVEAEYDLLKRAHELHTDEDSASANLTSVPDEIATLSLEEFASSDLTVDNYVTRRIALGDEPSPDRDLTNIELVVAKEILRRKALVGMHDDLPGAVDRFVSEIVAAAAGAGASAEGDDEKGDSHRIMNVVEARKCVQDLVDNEKEDPSSSSLIQEGSDAWNAIAELNKFDMELYEYAQELYQIQGGQEGAEKEEGSARLRR